MSDARPIFVLDDHDGALLTSLRSQGGSATTEWLHVTPSNTFVRHQGDATRCLHLFAHTSGQDRIDIEAECSTEEIESARKLAYRQMRLERFVADRDGRAWDVDLIDTWNLTFASKRRIALMNLADDGPQEILPPREFAERIVFGVCAEDSRILSLGRLSLCLYLDHVQDVYARSGAVGCDHYLRLAEIAESSQIAKRTRTSST